MKKRLQNLFEFISIGNSSIYEGDNIDNEILKVFGTSFNFAFYFFNKIRAVEDTKKSFLNSNFYLSRKVWNLLDGAVIKKGFKGALGVICSVKYRQKLFLKKTENTITLDLLKEIHNKIKSGFIQNQNLNEYESENINININNNSSLNENSNEKKLYMYKRDKEINDSKFAKLKSYKFSFKFF
jgi:hypothetical protein